MRMPPLAFFLVGLVFFTQVDDLLIPAPLMWCQKRIVGNVPLTASRAS